MSAAQSLERYLHLPCSLWPAACGIKVNNNLNLDSFDKNFFGGFKSNGKGVDCKDGESVYSTDPYDFSVSINLSLE